MLAAGSPREDGWTGKRFLTKLHTKLSAITLPGTAVGLHKYKGINRFADCLSKLGSWRVTF